MKYVILALLLVASFAASADVINVKSAPYNAVGDGVNDDTTEIQAALNAVPAAGGEVYIPAGTYKVSATLTIKSKTRVRGEGPRTSKLFLANGANADVLSNADQTNGNAGITIEDLEIDGNRVNQTVLNQVIGIDMQKVTDLTVTRNYVHDCVRDGINVGGQATARVRIVGNTSSHNGKSGANGGSGIAVTHGDNIHISGNTVQENLLCGVILEKNGYYDEINNVVVADNIVRSNIAGGIKTIGDDEIENPNENISITGNVIYAAGLEGIRIEHTRWYLVANNQIRLAQWQGIVIYGAGSIDGTITGNHIYVPGLYASNTYDGIYADSTQQRISITGNHIDGVAGGMRRAINLPSATNCLIVGNIIRGGTDATQLYAPSSTNVVASNKSN